MRISDWSSDVCSSDLVPVAADGMSPATLLRRIHDRAAELVDSQYRCWSEELRPELSDAGVRVLGRESWNARQTRWLRAYFREEIMPVLSPLGLDPAHPFPKILNKSLNLVDRKSTRLNSSH